MRRFVNLLRFRRPSTERFLQTKAATRSCLLAAWIVVCAVPIASADEPNPRATTADQRRLRDLNTHCPFLPPESKEVWEQRAEDLKLQLGVSLGVYPEIELDPVTPQIYGKIERDDYSIEKVTFESLPGFFVTGNLYRPSKVSSPGKVPGILCPHGHWDQARFYEASDAEIDTLLATGAERFESAARNHIQARCVQLARMGCVVFHWDMIGYCDSTQISRERAHGFAKQDKASEVTEDGWLLFSPLAESHAQSVLGLQTLAIRRAVDMLIALPDVDSERIAITGASGGGTQSFLGAALDERIRVAFPAVMVSTGMQGGCTCENACLLRTGTGNVEIAALIAPRPLGLTAADDWTRTMPKDGFPELQSLYDLMGAKEKVALFPSLHFGHNFNHVSRTSMYGWMNEHLELGLPTTVLERDFERATQEELTVWDDEHPQPPGGEAFERQLMKRWAEILDVQMKGQLNGDQNQVQALAQTLHDGWRATLGLTSFAKAEVQEHEPTQDANQRTVTLSATGLDDWQLCPSPEQKTADNSAFGTARSTELDHSQPLLDLWKPSQADLHIEVQRAPDSQPVVYYPVLAGQMVIEKTDSEGEPLTMRTVQQALVPNPRLAASYTYGYNQPLFTQRAQQLGLTLSWLRSQYPDQEIVVRGSGSNAALATAGVFCAQQLSPNFDQQPVVLEIDAGDFSFSKVADIRDPDFLPAASRFWGLSGLLASLRNVRIQCTNADEPSYSELGRLHELAGNTLESQ